MPDIKIWPVEEMVHEDEFTDRVEELASFTDTRVAVIIDEFQDMQFCIYNMPKELMDAKDRSDGYGAIRLANTFDRQAQSRKAPMLVSGSAVTMVFRTVMGGPLGGRFDFTYMKPMSVPDEANLLHTTLKYYGQGEPSARNSPCTPARRWEAIPSRLLAATIPFPSLAYCEQDAALFSNQAVFLKKLTTGM